MPFILCHDCGQISHEEKESRYYWCPCGQPLTDGDEISGLGVRCVRCEPRHREGRFVHAAVTRRWALPAAAEE